MFTAEIDHIDKMNSIYDHGAGTFEKYVPPLSTIAGNPSQSVIHSKELFGAVNESLTQGLSCKLLLVKGTKSGETSGPIKAAVDGDSWGVKALEGTADKGYRFLLVRTEE